MLLQNANPMSIQNHKQNFKSCFQYCAARYFSVSDTVNVFKNTLKKDIVNSQVITV